MKKNNQEENLFKNLKKKSPTFPNKEEIIDHSKINGEDEYVKELLKEKQVLFKQTTKRVIQLATKLTQEDYDLINYIAKKKHWMLVEVIENSLKLMAKRIQDEEKKK